MKNVTRSRLSVGVGLIVLGLGLYGMRYVQRDIGESLILTALGAVLLLGYIFSRSRLLLIAGGIVTGLGIGSFGERRWAVVGEFTEIGLGIGFLLIWVLGLIHERRSHWWPLIPASVLLLLGFNAMRRFRLFLFGEGWPLILVIIGALVLMGTMGRRGKASEG